MTLTSDADRRTPKLSSEDLFEQHRDLAASIARRYAATPHAADIGQVADIALWSAATRFDPTQGSFERFAAVTISGEIKKFLRRAGWAVRVGRRCQEDALRVRRIVDDLTIRLARVPSTCDLVAATGWPTDRVNEALRSDMVRFSAPESRDDISIRAELADSFEILIETLSDLDRAIVRMTYVWDLTQREISECLSMSQSMVHRRLRRAHQTLAAAFAD